MTATEDALSRVIADALHSLGAELVDVELRKGTLIVTVERGELDLDDVALVARTVSSTLDEHEDLGPDEPYELEVTSPGLERRLRRPEHFARSIGERISLRTNPGTPGARRVEGELLAVDADGIVMSLDGDDESLRLHFDAIERAHTVFDWRGALAESKRATRNEHDTPVSSGGGTSTRERKRPA